MTLFITIGAVALLLMLSRHRWVRAFGWAWELLLPVAALLALVGYGLTRAFG